MSQNGWAINETGMILKHDLSNYHPIYWEITKKKWEPTSHTIPTEKPISMWVEFPLVFFECFFLCLRLECFWACCLLCEPVNACFLIIWLIHSLRVALTAMSDVWFSRHTHYPLPHFLAQTSEKQDLLQQNWAEVRVHETEPGWSHQTPG